jgi:hypothetical protein
VLPAHPGPPPPIPGVREPVASGSAARGSTANSRRRGILILIAIGAALVLAAAIVIGITLTVNGAADPAPSLPQVGEPLDSHLQDLLDEVSP